mmetsp:Transcript_98413/g.300972  ORF Transcript_98413/g.300972 Transcript_98413/m.300972 type:complete len:353 (+) Transcript_98413:683-1741(+)
MHGPIHLEHLALGIDARPAEAARGDEHDAGERREDVQAAKDLGEPLDHRGVRGGHLQHLRCELAGLLLVCVGRRLVLLVQLIQVRRGKDTFHLFDAQDLELRLAFVMLHSALVLLGHAQGLAVGTLDEGDRLLVRAGRDLERVLDGTAHDLHPSVDAIALRRQLPQGRVELAVDAKLSLLGLFEIDGLADEGDEVPEIGDACADLLGQSLVQHLRVRPRVRLEGSEHLLRGRDALVHRHQVLERGLRPLRRDRHAVELRRQPLEVGNLPQVAFDLPQQALGGGERLDDVVPLGDLVGVRQGLREPLPEAPGANRRSAAVQEAQHRRAGAHALLRPRQHRQRREGRLVHVHEA